MSGRQTVMEPRLRATLEAKADQFGTSRMPFEPTRPREVAPLVTLDARRSTRGGRVRLVLAGAAVVAILGGVAVVATRGGGDDGTSTVGPKTSTHVPVAGAAADPSVVEGMLLPHWVPEGLDLWGFDWRVGPSSNFLDSRVQLFGRGDSTADGAVFVEIQQGDGQVVGTNPTTVRGVPADSSSAKEHPDSTTTLDWYEGGAGISASFTGMSQSEVVAFLDGLTWRSGDELAGFAPPADGGLTLLGETAPEASDPSALQATFDYLDGQRHIAPGEGLQLSIHTGVGGAGMTASYLQTWFHSTTRGDGMVEAYDPHYGTLRRDWPDGRRMWIDANGTAIDRATLAHVADEISAATGTEVLGIRQQVEDRFGSLPVVASAHVDAGVIEARGDDDLSTVCFVPAGGSRRCTTDLGIPIGGSFLVGDTWYVVAASNGEPPAVHAGEQQAERPDTDGLPGQVADAGGYHLLVVPVPAEAGRVTLFSNTGSVPFDRPPF